VRVRRFVEQVADFSSPSVFNPYRDTCPHADQAEAPRIRRENLERALTACLRLRVDTIWIARDLGYRGGRRTGLALTDEANLDGYGSLLEVCLRRATKGPIVAERTAAVVWQVIKSFNRPIFLWNVFPFHPHESSNELSNRCHTRPEREQCKPILLELMDLLQPTTIIAIGNDAQNGLADLGIGASGVRHPSYGGKSDFVAGLARLYGLGLPAPTQRLLAL